VAEVARPAFSAHIGYLFGELALRDRVAAAARCGFAAVEHPAPYGVPAAEMAGLLRASGIRYTQLALRSGDATRGEKGLGALPEQRQEFRASVREGLDYAEAVGARMVHAMAGVVPERERTSAHWDCYVENLAFAAGEAGERGIVVIVEAMSPEAVPGYFLPTPDDAARAIAEAGAPDLGLLLDVFHVASVGLDPAAAIATHAGVLRHVHLADHPGRHEPGTASIDFGRIADALTAARYDGVLGCEYVPAGATEDGLGWMRGGALAAAG
jgi:hydroxypyruvate isomerase